MMKSSGRTSGGRKRPAQLIRISIGIIGWLLSPLTPWNDAFVNVPLSLAISKILQVCCMIDTKIGYWIGYSFTNVLGLILMVLAGRGFTESKIDLKSIVQSILIALIMYIFLILLGIV
ncbi:hypothetical protein EYM_07710 [Ignicoccus islandicus DSM 13165]|uniref:Uncharacterized protein n=1 Tax=Ignicoccus islandicus DSM 13165 TaxID=940295 RepID=A0A0U3FAU8_9CREN|nr:hypothetical protein [Ignicoccus islandicus]ALU12809.1 hypothetical protein EYM_07710 [Ignicoccus islandicus DSM 13165]